MVRLERNEGELKGMKAQQYLRNHSQGNSRKICRIHAKLNINKVIVKPR